MRKKQILLLSETSLYYGRSIAEGVMQYALEKDWGVDFEPRGNLDPLPLWLNTWKGDGIISRGFNLKNLKFLHTFGLPIVEMAGHRKYYPANVVVDENILAEMAFQYFREKGFTSFGFYSYGRSWWSIARMNAFIEIVQQNGFTCDVLKPNYGNSNATLSVWRESEAGRLKHWLQSLNTPIAVFTPSDQHAQKVITFCRELKISIPESIAVLGVDNDYWYCKAMNPPLSSIDANGKLAGYRAAELLEKMLRGEKVTENPIKIPPLRLSSRKSTGVVAINDEDVVHAMQFIRENACSGINVSDVVHETLLSQKTLERRFRQYLNSTVSQEIVREQVEMAKCYLFETSLSVQTIAYKVGFSSVEYFVRVFKRYCLVTPSQYRQKLFASEKRNENTVEKVQ